MHTFFSLPCLLLALTALTACSHLDTTPEPRGEQTLEGKVHFQLDQAPPTGMSVTVRLVQGTGLGSAGKVLAEQTIPVTQAPPVAYSLGFRAEDLLPPNRARLEARVSVNGKLRYFSSNGRPVTPDSLGTPVDLWIDSRVP